MKSPAKPEPEARAVVAEMPEDSERASEREHASDGTEVASSTVVAAYQDDPTNSSANDSSAPAKPERNNKKRTRSRSGIEPNNVRKLRQEAMMSKAELARRAGVSPLTIDRVEAGHPCRMDTKRKILEALGLKPSARTEVWPDIDTT